MSAERLGRLSVVAHEARSPVAALAAIAQVFGSASQDERRTLTRLAAAAARSIERLVVDAAVASVRLEDVDLRELAEDAAVAARLGGSDVRVVGKAHLTLQADAVRVRQALDNLLANAARHAPGSAVIIEVGHAGGVASLSVSDGGPGIPNDDRARIFEPGVRQSGSDGSGLGLPLARAIAESHGGTLSVASGLNAGATFTLTLPTLVEP